MLSCPVPDAIRYDPHWMVATVDRHCCAESREQQGWQLRGRHSCAQSHVDWPVRLLTRAGPCVVTLLILRKRQACMGKSLSLSPHLMLTSEGCPGAAAEQLDAAYQEVKEVVSIPRGLGYWGDMVVTLRNNDKMELRALPQ